MVGLKKGFSCFTGVKTHLSLDFVIRKWYQGKLEYQDVNLRETFPAPYMFNFLVVTSPLVVQTVEVSSASNGECLVDSLPISTVVGRTPAKSPCTEVVEDNKEGIISNIQHAKLKRLYHGVKLTSQGLEASHI